MVPTGDAGAAEAAGEATEGPDGDVTDLTTRMVALEAFNRSDDYLFGMHGAPLGDSALVACLDAGWRPGLVGCSDEHGPRFGLEGRGRTGLWVGEHSRDGVREALAARRTFATRERGLRLDVLLGGNRMGGALPVGPVELAVDLAGSAYDGREVELQLLTTAAATGGNSPGVGVLAQLPAVVGEVSRHALDMPADVPWLLLRVADTGRGYGRIGPAGHAAATWAVAYASPWYR